LFLNSPDKKREETAYLIIIIIPEAVSIKQRIQRDNIKYLDMVSSGWVNIYLIMRDHIDVRHKDNLSFADFRVN